MPDPMPVKYDMKETKEVLDFVAGLAKAIQDAMKDGKIDFSDLAYLLVALQRLGPAIDNISTVPKEIADLDDAEAKDIQEYFAKKLDEVVDEEQLKNLINKGFAIAVAIASLVYEIRQIQPKPVPVPAA